MRLGLIGYGAIGQTVAQAFAPGCGDGVELVAILVRHGRPEASVRTSLEDFLRARPEVVLECAGHQAVREHGVRCLEAGADLVLTSIGALVEDELRLALERGRRRGPSPGGRFGRDRGPRHSHRCGGRRA